MNTINKEILIKNLSYKYIETSNYVLKNVNTSINQNDFVIITGPSGSGKSTLLNLIGGFYTHIGGEIKGEINIKGKNILDQKNEEIVNETCIVFQNPALQLHQQTVLDEVMSAPMYIGKPYVECKNIARDLIDKILGSEFYDKNVQELSSGQQQKVALAASLALGSNIILLDEPFSFLDSQSKTDMLNTLKDLNKEGATIVLITHDIKTASKTCNKIVMMDQGKIIIQGTPESVISSKEVQKIYPKEKTYKSKLDRKSTKGKILNLENISYQYPNTNLGLNNINLNFSKGQIHGIVGPNGAGKTTLLNVIMGFTKPSKGIIKFKNEDITTWPIEKRAKSIGYVTQDPIDMFFESNLLDEVSAGPRFFDRENPNKLAEEALKKFNLYQYRNKHPDSISGGEKSKLGFIDIAVNEPEIYLLDEPEFGLDIRSWQDLIKQFMKLKEEGKTIIMITHNIDDARSICDTIINIEKGKLV